MKITIYGASDDCVEVDGCEGADEFYADGTSDSWHADLQGPDPAEAMHVTVWFDRNGCWQVGVGQPGESVSFPAWPLTFRQGTQHEAEYSVVLEVEAPKGTRLTNVWPQPQRG